MEIKKVISAQEIEKTASLAKVIWNEHYLPIIGQAQLDYMLENFQSAAAIEQHIKDNCEYYLVVAGGQTAGYFAIQANYAENLMFLSKLYISQECRGQGLAKSIIDYIADRAKTAGLSRIYLNVNKHNYHAIEFYFKMGFTKIKSLQQDIGNDFIMDDYGMEKKL